jgi:ABC-type lipoprotein release transport system permease subunit
VLGLVIRQGMLLALVGIALGVAVALGGAPRLAGLLFQVEPWDLRTFLAIPAFLSFVAFTATFFPARRATRVDPMTALRCE